VPSLSAEACCFLILGLPVMAGSGAVTGLIPIITGHAILRYTDRQIYQLYSIASSAQVGAVGGAIMIFPMSIVTSLLSGCDCGIQWGLNTILSFAFLVGAAAIGRDVLAHNNHDVMGSVDYITAAVIGTLVLWAASIALVLVIFLIWGCCSCVGAVADLGSELGASFRIRRTAKAAKTSPADAERGEAE